MSILYVYHCKSCFPPMMFHLGGTYVCRINDAARKRMMSLLVCAILLLVQLSLFWGLGDKKDMVILYLMN